MGRSQLPVFVSLFRLSDARLPHFVANLLQPRSALSHCPSGMDRSALSPQRVRLDCKKNAISTDGNASGMREILHQKAVMPLPKLLSPYLRVWVLDCMYVHEAFTVISGRQESIAGADGADHVHEYLQGVLVVFAPWGSTSFLPFGGSS